MAMTINPLSAALGAEITGIDLAAPVDDDLFAVILDTFHRDSVVVFRDQKLAPARQIAFSRRFGDIQYHVSPEVCLTDHPEVMVLSNEIRDGKYVGNPDAGSDWHADHSYMQAPTRISLLHALRVPDHGGDTEWANMYTAYDTLPAATRQRIEGLIGVHTFNRLRNRRVAMPARHGDGKEHYKRSPPDAYHAIARSHEATGRKALYVSARFTVAIKDMDDGEAQPLLDELFAHQLRREFVYHHEWRLGDLLMWDNRCTLHVACGGIEPPGIRHLHRTTIQGEAQAG